MDTVEWIARSPCWLAAALRGFANYGLGLSGLPGMVPISIDPAPARLATAARRMPPDLTAVRGRARKDAGGDSWNEF